MKSKLKKKKKKSTWALNLEPTIDKSLKRKKTKSLFWLEGCREESLEKKTENNHSLKLCEIEVLLLLAWNLLSALSLSFKNST